MKNSILILSFAVFTTVFTTVFFACNSSNEESSNNDENTETVTGEYTEANFKVSGNCSMCEERIETAALGVQGVESADWDKETKMINISHKETVNIHDVHQAIADAGHDADHHKAKDEVYENLPACCLYRDGDGGHTH